MTTERDNGPDGRDGGSRWPWLLLGLTLIALAGGVYWWMSRGGDQDAAASVPPPLVRVTPVAAAQSVVLRQTGFVRAADEVDVVTQISERITRVGPQFQVGLRVSEGDLLFALDDVRFQADRDEAQARLDQANAALTEAELALDRQRQLAAENFASDAALDDAQVAYARAQADLAMARAQLQRADLAVDDTLMTAPFDAIVTEQAASRGQFVQAGTPVGHIVATDAARVRMGLLPSDIDVLGAAEAAVGLPVTVTNPATGRTLAIGQVTGVVPAIETETRTTSLIVRIEDPFAATGQTALRVDELVEMELEVPLAGRAAFRIAAEALKGADRVWRVTDGILTPLDVTLLAREADSVVVRHPDLAEGDTVLLSDLVAPAAGDTVRVETDDTVRADDALRADDDARARAADGL